MDIPDLLTWQNLGTMAGLSFAIYLCVSAVRVLTANRPYGVEPYLTSFALVVGIGLSVVWFGYSEGLSAPVVTTAVINGLFATAIASEIWSKSFAEVVSSLLGALGSYSNAMDIGTLDGLEGPPIAGNSYAPPVSVANKPLWWEPW